MVKKKEHYLALPLHSKIREVLLTNHQRQRVSLSCLKVLRSKFDVVIHTTWLAGNAAIHAKAHDSENGNSHTGQD